tara:strand:- start:307 stop:639 length:333 start_codon:yes stop_codon:yes gene_type:complete
MQHVSAKEIGGKIVKKDARYIVTDNNFGENLVLSSTFLTGKKSTNGHLHEGQEEVYFFVSGSGLMEIDNEFINVKEGDIVCVEGGEFHRVYNTTDVGLLFVCVFDGKRKQ